MEIQSTAFNLFFPKINDIRRRVFNFEDNLRDHFIKPFNLIPVPDDAPAEIPRMTATSLGGHSTLNVSMDRLSLNTRYDNRFNKEWGKCRDYLQGKIYPMVDSIDDVVGNSYLFSGITTEVVLDEVTDEPLQFLTNKFMNLKSTENLFDVNFKLTYTIEDTYYINMTFSNYRIYTGIGNPEIESPAGLQEAGQGISLLLDINDRYGFNYTKGYTSNFSRINRIMELTSDILETKIQNIITGGL